VIAGERKEEIKGMKEWKKEHKWGGALETCMWTKVMTR
jgi:hypothetical protein